MRTLDLLRSDETRRQELTIEKSAGNGTINAGETASITITAGNTGVGDAFNVTIENELPEGIDWVETPDLAECEITGGVLSRDVGTLAPEDAFSVTVEGETDAADCGTLTNTATADAANDDPVTSDLIEIVVNCPDLTVVKEDEDDEISAGEDAVFIITVTNNGAGTAFDVTLTDNLPDGLAWTLDPAVEGCAIADGTLECAFEVVPAGASIVIVVKAQTATDDCRDLVNLVTVGAGNEPEDAVGNNEDVATIAVQCGGVEITKVLCQVGKARNVAFLIIEPDGTTTGDDDHDPKQCKAAKDVAFTIDGDAIAGPITVKTGAGGKVSLTLPPGDYTITEKSTGASYGFTVYAGGTTLVKVFNFEVKPVKPTPTPTPKPETPTKLPDTGAGPAGDPGGQHWLILFLTLVVFGGAAYTLRRRTA